MTKNRESKDPQKKKPRALNFTVGKYLICAIISLGVAIFGLVISLPPLDVSFYPWYPEYLKELSTFQASLFELTTFTPITANRDSTLKPIEQRLQNDHKVDMVLPKRYKSSDIVSGNVVQIQINQQIEPIAIKLKCNALVLNYTIDDNALASDGKSALRVYAPSQMSIPCSFFTKYDLDNYILLEQDPIITLGKRNNWDLTFFSMTDFPSWLRTLSLVFFTFPGIAITYLCSLCFYKRYRYRWKVINGKLKHESSI